jgi:DNA-binding response OmpR family regulator
MTLMTMSTRRVLVADDDRDVRELIRILLERAGYEVIEATDGRECLRAFYERHPELVVLDLRMPVLDGWAALERIREVADVPVLILTARGDELDRVRGLRAGADDYVQKPFGRQELVARIEALLRRASTPAKVQSAYSDDLVEINFAERRVTAGGQAVELTPLEFRLLTAFVRHPGQVLSHDQLLKFVWGDATSHTREEVRLYVGYLRGKLRAAIGAEPPIETVRGFGYRYVSGRASRSDA